MRRYNTRGGAWNAAGTILFTRSATEPLYRVPASGGKAVAATEVTAPHLGHRYPQFLPDGQHFLFFAFGPPESQGIYVGSLDSTKATRLLDAESAPLFAPPDYVLFARQGTVLAQQIDLETLQTVGDPVPVARQVATPQGTVASVALSASAAGPSPTARTPATANCDGSIERASDFRPWPVPTPAIPTTTAVPRRPHGRAHSDRQREQRRVAARDRARGATAIHVESGAGVRPGLGS